MIAPVSQNLLEDEIKTSFDISLADSEIIAVIENKFFKILEEDKKLDKPVFLFIKQESISKILYFLAGIAKRPVAVGIAGETASGKSTFVFDILDTVSKFQQKLELDSVITKVNTDDYYYDRSKEVTAAGGIANFSKNYDFDVPEAIELDLLKHHIEQLVLGNNVMLPKYDMSGTTIRYDNHTLATPSRIILSEGLFNLTDKIKDVFDISLYVSSSAEVQKERFFRRAVERGLGHAAESIYNNAVSKAELHIQPTSKNADIIINGEASREDYRKIAQKFLDMVEFAYLSKAALMV